MNRAVSEDLQRQMAAYAVEAGKKVQRRGLFGSDRAVADEQRQCVCGLCVRDESMPRTHCSLFADGGATVVVREQKEICRPVCISTSSVRMLQRLIRTLLRDIAAAAGSDGPSRLNLQRDDASYERGTPPRDMPASRQTYVFDLQFLMDDLHVSFFAPLDRLGEAQYTIVYRIGEHLELSQWVPDRALARLRMLLDQALIAGDGKKYSLVLRAPALPRGDRAIAGIRWSNDGDDVFRARPVFVFLQAQPRRFMSRKGHFPE